MALGLGMTVQALQATMGYREFIEWMAYYQMEPWDETRADWRAGMVAAVIANVNRGKDQRAYKPDEFMPKFGPEKTPPGGNWKTMQQRLRMAAAVNKNRDGDGVTNG